MAFTFLSFKLFICFSIFFLFYVGCAFWSSFRFTSKVSRKYREFSYTSFFSTYFLEVLIEFFTMRDMWALSPRPGTEPASPALEGELLTTGLLGKSLELCSFCTVLSPPLA